MGKGSNVSEERPSFTEVVRLYERPVWALLAAAVGDEETARDLTQETFLRAFRGYEKFRGESALFTWLYAIARNVIRRHRRRERVRRLFLARLAGEKERARAPEEGDRDVWREVRNLPEPFREVVLLYYFADRSVAQIAETLSLPEGTVKSRLARGRKILAGRLRTKR